VRARVPEGRCQGLFDGEGEVKGRGTCECKRLSRRPCWVSPAQAPVVCACISMLLVESTLCARSSLLLVHEHMDAGCVSPPQPWFQ
jgi:hypothetical protein